MVVFPDAGKAVLPALTERVQGRRRDGSLPGGPGRQGRRQLRHSGSATTSPTTASTGRPGSRRTSPAAATSCSSAARPGNSQSTTEYNALRKNLPDSYKFIGQTPFQPTNWDPTLTQTAAHRRHREVPQDRRHRLRLRPDAGQLAAAVPQERTARSRRWPPPTATRCRCFWQQKKARQPVQDDRLSPPGTTTSGWQSTTRSPRPPAARSPRDTSSRARSSRTRSAASRTRCSCKPDLPGDVYLSAQMPGDEQAKLSN